MQGAFDPLKLETIKQRLQGSIRNSISYIRAGPSLRQHRGFKNDVSILPLLAISACVSHLRHLRIEQHFPVGEADLTIAELAISRNAYIASSDSDFFILAHGAKGYIPLDTFAFAISERDFQETEKEEDGQGGWAQVRNGKARFRSASTESAGGHKSRQVNLGGPNLTDNLHRCTLIFCTYYKSSLLAAHLALPGVYWLPLLAVLSGTDYYKPPVWRTAGSPSSIGGGNVGVKRFELTARAIVKCSARRSRQALSLEMLRSAVATIVDDLREFAISASEMQNIVNGILDALPQYMNSRLSDPAFPQVHPASIGSALFLCLPHSSSDPYELVKTRLLNAQENGNLRRDLLQVLQTGIYAPHQILEDPDTMSCAVSCGRHITKVVWAVLHEVVGIPQPEVKESTDMLEGHERSVGEQPCPMTPQGIPMQDADINGKDLSFDKPFVKAYIRRGAALVLERLAILDLALLLPSSLQSPSIPALSRSTQERYYLFLQATSSFTPHLAELHGPHLTLIGIVASLRHLEMVFCDSKSQAWTPAMRRSILCMAYLVNLGKKISTDTQYPTNNDIQRAAQVVSTLYVASMLSEALLLTSLIPPSENLFEGKVFHQFLHKSKGDLKEILIAEGVNSKEFEDIVEVMEDGLPAGEADRPPNVAKKARKRSSAQKRALPGADGPLNLFEVLSIDR